MTRRIALAALLAVSAGCSITSSKTEGPKDGCTPAVNILGTRAVCASNADCCSYNCQNGRCWETKTLGGVCRTSIDCGPNMTCKSGVCVTGLLCHDNGDVCTGANGPNTQCCGGYCSGFSAGVSYGECTLNTPPVVVINGGNPRNASRNVLQTVTGSASDPDGNTVACTWTVTPPGRTAPVITDQHTCSGAIPALQFTPDLEGPWTVALAGDDNFNLDPAHPRPVVKTVTMNVVNDAPVAATVLIAGNEPATVYANLDSTGHATITTVDGSSSSDRNGDTFTYLWSVQSSPSPITLGGATTARPTFTADAVGDYVLSLTVTDPPWGASRDPIYRLADRPGANSTPLTVTVKVARYVQPLADWHDLVDADYAKTANKIVLLGHEPIDPYRSNGMLWVYDVATGQEGMGIAIMDPVTQGWSNLPSSVGVTSDGLKAVVGDSLNAWTITPLDATAVVAKLNPATNCLTCSAVLPIGDVVVVGTRHAFLFNSSGTAHFVDLDLNNNNNSFTDGGGYGRSGAGYSGSYLFVANTTQGHLDRYTVNPSGASWTWETRYSPFSCSNAKLWAGQSGEYVFDSCGEVFSNGAGLTKLTTPLTPAPAHVDSLATGYVTLGLNGQQVNRYTSTLGTNGTDLLPIWADPGGGKEQTYGMFAFLAADGSRIVFLRTDETIPRYGVLRFGP